MQKKAHTLLNTYNILVYMYNHATSKIHIHCVRRAKCAEEQSAPVLVSEHSVLNLQGYTGFKWCNAMYVLAIKIHV